MLPHQSRGSRFGCVPLSARRIAKKGLGPPAHRGSGVRLPRRKYGHLVRPHQPPPREKCRLCRLGYSCPVHMDTAEIERRRREADKVRGSKEAKRAAKSRRRGKGRR